MRWTEAAAPSILRMPGAYAGKDLAVKEPTAVIPPAYRPPARPNKHIIGEDIFNAVSTFVSVFMRLPYPSTADLIALWIIHTHIRDNEGKLCTPSSPLLGVFSETGGCGKTNLMEILRLLCAMTDDEMEVEPTGPAVRCMLSKEHLTVLLDEADILFGSGARKEMIRALINASYLPKARYSEVRGGVRVKYPVYSPVAYAGLDKIQKGTNTLLDTMLSRTLQINLRKAKPGDAPPDIMFHRQGQSIGQKGKMQISAWVGAHQQEILEVEPDFGTELELREAQLFYPLAQIAYTMGGSVPDRFWAAAYAQYEANDFVKEVRSMKRAMR